jgi:ribosomal protein S18 acetylase RimI-like enzyme
MNYLSNKGIKDAMLYVDADNEKALKLYESLGFH